MIRTNTHRFGAMRSFLLVSLLAIGLVAITTSPAQASGTWNKTGSMNSVRIYHTATLLPNGEVLAAGGVNPTEGYLASAELYNPATGKWTMTGSMHVARFYHSAILLQNGRVLVVGGTNGPTATSSSRTSFAARCASRPTSSAIR